MGGNDRHRCRRQHDIEVRPRLAAGGEVSEGACASGSSGVKGASSARAKILHGAAEAQRRVTGEQACASPSVLAGKPSRDGAECITTDRPWPESTERLNPISRGRACIRLLVSLAAIWRLIDGEGLSSRPLKRPAKMAAASKRRAYSTVTRGSASRGGGNIADLQSVGGKLTHHESRRRRTHRLARESPQKKM